MHGRPLPGAPEGNQIPRIKTDAIHDESHRWRSMLAQRRRLSDLELQLSDSRRAGAGLTSSYFSSFRRGKRTCFPDLVVPSPRRGVPKVRQ